MSKEPVKFTVVSPIEAKKKPYPYVQVNADGSVRELSPGEKNHLEEPFFPGDGGRPAVKTSYDQKNGWGNLRGFCKRSHIPPDIEIQPYEEKS